MSTTREGTKKPKTTIEPRVISWEERKTLADKEAEVLEKQIEDLKTWVLYFIHFLLSGFSSVYIL